MDPETLSPETQEAVDLYIDVVPHYRYCNDSLLTRRLNILHTKKWVTPVVTKNCMTWTYLVFPNGTFISKSVKDDGSVYMGKPYNAPSKKRKTPARESTSDAIKATPSSFATAQIPRLQKMFSLLEDEEAGCFAPYVGPIFDLHLDLKVDSAP